MGIVGFTARSGVYDGDKEIVTNERYFVMPWKMVNVDGKRVSLKEAVDEIFSNQDELTNSTYVTLKLYDKGNCKSSVEWALLPPFTMVTFVLSEVQLF